MKVIQGMKGIQALQIKAGDLRKKIQMYCSDSSIETPAYGEDQRNKIKEWLQSHSDTVKEILRLRIAIQRTNLATEVTMELGGKQVKKTIAEWIHRRRDLAGAERSCWEGLTDKNIKEGYYETPGGGKQEVKLRRYYDPNERDKNIEMYRGEPGIIDATLEVINAVTELIES